MAPSRPPNADRGIYFTTGAGPVRHAIEQRVAVPLIWLNGQSRLLVGAIPLALAALVAVLTGPIVIIPGVLLVLLVGLIQYLAWPVGTPGSRTLRVLVLVAIAALTAANVVR